MPHNPSFLHARQLHPSGSAQALTAETLAANAQGDARLWVHLRADSPGTRELLNDNFQDLDSIVVDALLAGETRPRILDFPNGVLLILRGINLNENAEPEDMVSIRLWIESNRIISLERRALKATEDLLERLAAGRGPKNSGDFITQLLAQLFQRMEPVFQELDERLDNIEEEVMETPDTRERQEITSIRKEAIMYRRYIAPQRDVIAHLRLLELPWLDATHKRQLQEVLDHVIRYIEDLDTIRERAQIVKDELTNALSDRMNKNLYVLSVLSAIFLPLGFLTGLLGINVGGIPGSEDSNAFAIFCVILGAIICLQLFIFKKLRWF